MPPVKTKTGASSLASDFEDADQLDRDGEKEVTSSRGDSNTSVASRAEAARSNRGVKSSMRPDGHSHDEKDHAGPDHKDGSARFDGDKELEEIATGGKELEKGAKGLSVIKLQQALVDMGYLPSVSSIEGVDGDFGKRTKKALLAFQKDAGVPQSGELDKATMEGLHKSFDTRKPYLDNATYDAKDPGTRPLSADEKAAVNEALVPARGSKGGPSTFTEEVGGEKYGDRMRDRLGKLIGHFIKELHTDKEPLRADPKKNFHDWSVLEGTALASKNVTDAVYGSYATGATMTAASGNFVDQWEDEAVRNSALGDDEKKAKAEGKVWYFVAANCATISREHGAVPSDPAEKAILEPIVESFIDTPAKVEGVLKTEQGWEGAQLEGVVYLQRYKQKDGAGNRAQLWELFHTCIHEYIHALAHTNFKTHADDFDARGDGVRYNALIEGFCDFFTENVRATVTVSEPLRKQVEGPHYDPKAAAPAVSPGTYPSKAQAEQVVSIVGINNAQAAYFLGEVDKIGK